MTFYVLIKYLHVLGAIVILGTGSGIAFFMLMAHLSREAAFIARTAATVLVADMLFTLTAVILQPWREPAAHAGFMDRAAGRTGQDRARNRIDGRGACDAGQSMTNA